MRSRIVQIWLATPFDGGRHADGSESSTSPCEGARRLPPEFTCVDNRPAKVAPGFSPANAGPGRPKGLRHITNTSELWA